MPKMPLQDRKAEALRMYSQGASPERVAQRLEVSLETARRYKREFKEEIAREASQSTGLLSSTLPSMIETLNSISKVEFEAWEGYERDSKPVDVPCPECGESLHIDAAPSNSLQSWLKLALEAQKEKAKVFGVVGIKPEVQARNNAIETMHTLILNFMSTQLDSIAREKVQQFVNTPEMRRLAGILESGQPMETGELVVGGQEVVDDVDGDYLD